MEAGRGRGEDRFDGGWGRSVAVKRTERFLFYDPWELEIEERGKGKGKGKGKGESQYWAYRYPSCRY